MTGLVVGIAILAWVGMAGLLALAVGKAINVADRRRPRRRGKR